MAASKTPSPRAEGPAEEPLLEGSPAAARAGGSLLSDSLREKDQTGQGAKRKSGQRPVCAGEGRWAEAAGGRAAPAGRG